MFSNTFAVARVVAGGFLAATSIAGVGCGADVKLDFETCVTDRGSFEVGEQFTAGDGCNTCTCQTDGSVSCSEMGCVDCTSAPPSCGEPLDPSCTLTASCQNNLWTCEETCIGDCTDSPPIDCLAPPDCFHEAPVCIGGQLQCGPLYCDKPDECGPAPECAQPGNPDCFAYAVCDGFEWSCITECTTSDLCEQKFPEGAALASYLVVQSCGCEAGAVCEMACEGNEACENGAEPSGECGDCIQDAGDNQYECVLNAVFGPDCQNSPECAGFLDCVLSN